MAQRKWTITDTHRCDEIVIRELLQQNAKGLGIISGNRPNESSIVQQNPVRYTVALLGMLVIIVINMASRR